MAGAAMVYKRGLERHGADGETGARKRVEQEREKGVTRIRPKQPKSRIKRTVLSSVNTGLMRGLISM